MTIIVECTRPFVAVPGRFTSRIMHRVWWGWFAISVLRIPLHELAMKSYDWRLPDGQIYRPANAQVKRRERY